MHSHNPSRPLALLRGSRLGTPHAVLSRLGGCSLPPFSSLNLSYGVGDHPAHVAANRELVKQALGAKILVSAAQVHGERVGCIGAVTQDTELEGYDALITDRAGVALLIQQADCQAVLLHDPRRRVVAAIHCGWRGNVANIIGQAVAEMVRSYRCNPADLRALISPSLGPCCAEFVNFATEFPPALHPFLDRPHHVDLWRLSAAQLTEAGVQPARIETMGICTVCNPDYFSYRRSKKEGLKSTGRNGSLILLDG